MRNHLLLNITCLCLIILSSSVIAQINTDNEKNISWIGFAYGSTTANSDVITLFGNWQINKTIMTIRTDYQHTINEQQPVGYYRTLDKNSISVGALVGLSPFSKSNVSASVGLGYTDGRNIKSDFGTLLQLNFLMDISKRFGSGVSVYFYGGDQTKYMAFSLCITFGKLK
jgi:hypothetical protein